MRTAIYGDVHGNLPAFEIFVSKTRSQVDMYLNLGDLVNYGPWSNECVDLALSLPSHGNILGNHEELFLNPVGLSKEIHLVQLFFEKTYPMFDRHTEISFFSQTVQLGKFLASHTIGEQRIYPDTTINLAGNHLIGHTHHQFLYRNGGYELINPGSIGQNRKRIDTLQYAIYDEEHNLFDFFSEKFNPTLLIQKMHSLSYPEECLEYYLGKM